MFQTSCRGQAIATRSSHPRPSGRQALGAGLSQKHKQKAWRTSETPRNNLNECTQSLSRKGPA